MAIVSPELPFAAASAPARPVPAPAPHSEIELRLLDDPHEWQAFSRPAQTSGTGCWESNVVIEGMYCAACSFTVEDTLLAVPGVRSAQVSAASRRARIVWSQDQVKPSVWMAAVQQSGYRALPANDVFVNERRRVETRKALWRWLVAGLCMMQVMMYAYPAYTAKLGDLSVESERLLRWGSCVLSLPVLLFSCGPFFSSAWRDLRRASISMDLPVAIGIAITFMVSSAGTFDMQGMFGREVYFDSFTMFVFFLLTGRWLELRLRDRTAGALESLMNRLPDSVERRVADGQFERVAVRRLLVDDVLRVHPGEAFAADGVVEQGTTMVDEALLTGESRALHRAEGGQVVAGSHNLSATVLVRVQRLGVQTRFAQIVALMESASLTKPRGVQLVDRMAKPFLLMVLLAAVLACVGWWAHGPEHALMVAVSVLVVTCPCALSLATPAAMLAAAGNLARSGILVRNLSALEALAEVDTLVFDKTGTLTQDAMVLGAVQVRAGYDVDAVVQMAAALARHSLHPASRALCAAADQQAAVRSEPSPTVWSCALAHETPGAGLEGTVTSGNSQVHGNSGSDSASAMPAVHTLRLGSAQFCSVSAAPSDQLCVYVRDAQGWLATFTLVEALRAQAAVVVAQLRQAGVQVHMLSGDSSTSVARIAAELQIDQARACCSPDDKLQVLQQLQQQKRKVVMVGDGLNDGPVLAGAQVSFAFGKAVPLAQSRSDFVVLGDQLMSVVDAMLLARKTMRVVRQNLWWALFYNAACIPLAIAGWLPAWLAGLGMACSSLVVVANALRLTKSVRQHKEH